MHGLLLPQSIAAPQCLGSGGDKVVCTHGRCFRRIRRVGDRALALGCGLGLSMPGSRFIRSVPSPAAALCIFASSSVEMCWGEGLAVGGQGEVSMWVLLTHIMARTRAAVGRCLHIERVLIEQSSGRHPNGCWRQLVWGWGAWGSAASSGQASHPLSSRECRFSWLG